MHVVCCRAQAITCLDIQEFVAGEDSCSQEAIVLEHTDTSLGTQELSEQ